MARLMLYSLLNNKGRTDLTINLTGHLTDFDNHHTNTLEINLPSGFVCLNRNAYMNTGNIYDNGTVFFIVANKQFCIKQAKRLLMQHALNKTKVRRDNLDMFIIRLEKELVAA